MTRLDLFVRPEDQEPLAESLRVLLQHAIDTQAAVSAGEAHRVREAALPAQRFRALLVGEAPRTRATDTPASAEPVAVPSAWTSGSPPPVGVLTRTPCGVCGNQECPDRGHMLTVTFREPTNG